MLNQALSKIIHRDPFRMDCLRALRALNLPQGYLGAGFVRNAIWDDLHNKARPTPLNDVDVVYFSDEITVPQSKVSVENTIESLSQPGGQAGVLSEAKAQEKAFEHELARFVPNANWQVKIKRACTWLTGTRPIKAAVRPFHIG